MLNFIHDDKLAILFIINNIKDLFNYINVISYFSIFYIKQKILGFFIYNYR